MQSREELFVKMALDAWNAHIDRTNEIFNSLSNEDLQQEAAPGRNRGVYLLGHLAGVHDRMLPLLGLGKLLDPEMVTIFVDNPDRAVEKIPSTTGIRQYWKDVNTTLEYHFMRMTPDEWFQRHQSISEADFATQPHRNRLNVLISRTNHLAEHLGQLLYLVHA